MKMLFHAILICAGLAITARAGDQSIDSKNLPGTWLPVRAELGGHALSDEALKRITLKLDNGKYEVIAESLDKGTYTADTTAKPYTMDITGVEGANAGKKIAAIYEINGDTLRVCYELGDGPRPTEFKCPGASHIFLVTYKRKHG